MRRVTATLPVLLGLITGPAAAQDAVPPLPVPLRALAPQWLQPITVIAGFGYPPNSADRRRWPALLTGRDFALIEQEFDALKAHVTRDIRNESLLYDSCLGLEDAHPALSPAFHAWVAQWPKSSNAVAARAQFRLGRALSARGTRFVRDTPQLQLDSMAVLAKAAWTDAMAVLARDSTHYCAYSVLLAVGRIAGDSLTKQTVIDRALRLCPGTYFMRDLFMYTLEPRWGGSWNAMQAFADAAAPYQELNPRLRNLRGHVFAAR